MPAFDAGAVVDALDWDFTAAGVRKKGTIPEPSDAAIGRFLDDLKGIATKARDMGATIGPESTPDQMLEAVTSFTGDKFVDLMDEVATAFAQLCGNHPDKDTLLKLPLRVRVAFYAWVQGEVVRPEAGGVAGTAPVQTLRPVAAG